MAGSLRTRLWLSYLVVIGISLSILVVAISLYLIRNPFEIRQALQRLRLISVIVVQRSGGLDSLTSPDIAAAAGRVDQAFDVRVLIYNSQSELLADSRQGSASPLPNPMNRIARPLILQSNIVRDTGGSSWIFVARTIQNGYSLVLATPRPKVAVVNFFRDELFAPFVQAGIVAFMVALLLSLWMSNWITAPLKQIASAAGELAKGRHTKIEREGPREIRELAASFNEMAAKVTSTQQSQKDLIANVSHDLKTPLTSIQGFAQAIMDGTAGDRDAANQAARVIYDEAGHMHRLVRDLLDLARLDSGMSDLNLAPVDLKEFLEQIAQRFTPLASAADVQFHLESESLPHITMDAERLSQVLANLLDNAIKYSGGGEVRLVARRLGAMVELLVIDSGPGIPGDQIGRIFERFYQVDKARTGGGSRGVGLGLAIAKEIVEMHAGSLRAVNNAEAGTGSKGSTFTIQIPVAGPKAMIGKQA